MSICQQTFLNFFTIFCFIQIRFKLTLRRALLRTVTFWGRLGVDVFFFISLPLCFVRLGVDAFFFSSLPLCFLRLGVDAFFSFSLPLCFERLGVDAFFFSPPTIILTHLGLFQKSFLHRKIFSRKCLKINNFYFYAQPALKIGRFFACFLL